MQLSIHPDVPSANRAAAALLAGWLSAPGVRNLMLPGGNTPLELYRLIAEMRPSLAHLRVFALDEYVGVPADEPRNCANLIRRTAVEPWGVPPAQYFTIRSLEADALASVRQHEHRIEAWGGLDVLVLGLGQNGHLGFNEPGSPEDCGARVLDLDATSIEANRRWFSGDYSPVRGATTGLKTLLAARQVLILTFGPPKADAVKAMVEGPCGPVCPASFLQGHPCCHLVLDTAAAAGLNVRHAP